MSEQESFGTRLKQALLNAKMSQADLAQRLDVSRAIVSLWVAGTRECPLERVEQIATLLGTDSSFLRGAFGVAEEAIAEMGWAFRRAPDDGGRDYGNSNVFATPPDVPTMVRESGQNSKDQKLHSVVHLRYTLIELSRGSSSYEEFFEAIRLESLRSSLEAAARTGSRLGNKFKAALERLDSENRLLLLRIDDFGTTGLHGTERSESSLNPFAALIRNNLDSSKSSSTAQGSYGLGKATLWRCSDISTVLFSSRVGIHHEEKKGLLRFIGKAELTWHEDGEKQAFAGPGWLGAGNLGDSVWAPSETLAPLFLDREQLPLGVSASTSSGTSALIVAFRDPKAESSTDPERLVRQIADAAALNFWPAMVDGDLMVTVARQVDGGEPETTVVKPDAGVAAPFVEALRAHRNDEIASHAEPGDTARVSVDLHMPSSKSSATAVPPGEPAGDAECQLLVRLARPEDLTDKRYLSSVALVRGRGMVVKYWERTNIVVGGRPFHAVLLAGEAGGKGPAQVSAERFLRLSEPPAHNQWELCEDLKDNYERGAGQRIQELFDEVTRKLREIVRPQEEGIQEEPEELRRLLRLQVQQPEPVRAKLRRVNATFDGNVWLVSGEIAVLDRRAPIRTRLNLAVMPESGTGIPLPWETLSVVQVNRGTASRVDDNAILIGERTSSLRFEARSMPSPAGLSLERCAAQVSLSVESSVPTA